MIHLLYVAVLIVAMAALLRRGPAARDTRVPNNPEYDLLLMTGGDRNTVERLINAERRRAPELSRRRCADRAVKRWVAALR